MFGGRFRAGSQAERVMVALAEGEQTTTALRALGVRHPGAVIQGLRRWHGLRIYSRRISRGEVVYSRRRLRG